MSSNACEAAFLLSIIIFYVSFGLLLGSIRKILFVGEKHDRAKFLTGAACIAAFPLVAFVLVLGISQ